jgi:hypothetical protein
MEEENHAAVREVYSAVGHSERVRYQWYAGDHDFPPEARASAIAWFRQWLVEKNPASSEDAYLPDEQQLPR